MLKLIVDRDHFTGMQSQIASQIAALIRAKVFCPGEMLPSEIKLAETHGISRNVVREAYQILKNKKLIKTDGRRGTVVINDPDGNAVFEYLRLQLSTDLKEKIEVVSLFQNMSPNKFVERELTTKVEQLFADYLEKYPA